MTEQPIKTAFFTDQHAYAWADQSEVQLEAFKAGSETFTALVTVIDENENVVEFETVNLRAGQTRKRFAKELAKWRGSEDVWDERLRIIAYTSSRRWAEGASSLVRLTDIEVDYSQPSLLLPPFIPESGVVVDYGSGSAGKSMFELAKLLTIATGHPFLGLLPTRTGPVSYFDWEDSGQTIRERAQALCDAAGIAVPENFHYREMDRPVTAGEERIRREIEETQAICAVFDSIGMMLGGDPSDPVMVIPAVNVMKRTGIACIGIHHLSAEAAKSTDFKDKQKSYGSVYIGNGARSTWFYDRFQEEEADEGYLYAFQTKVNRGKKSKPLAWHISYENDAQGYLRGLTYTQRSADDYFSRFQKNMPAGSLTVPDAVYAFLERRTSSGLARYQLETIWRGVNELLGKQIAEQSVRNALNKGRRDGLFVSFDSDGKTVWALASDRGEF